LVAWGLGALDLTIMWGEGLCVLGSVLGNQGSGV
jgi:hypothetical protein